MIQRELLIGMYEKMLLIRYFEEKAVALFRDGTIGGAVHPSIGQEAVAVGVCAHLDTDDYITSTHRGHGHHIAKGADIGRMMAELIGKESGYCRGKGGSMHICDPSIGILGSNGIVGAGMPIAVGAAFKIKYRHEQRRMVVCFFGDGGANQGSFHESLNMAAIYNLPVLFVCENNRWAISTRSEYATSGKGISNRSCAYGIPGILADGNDVVDVYRKTAEAVERCRRGKGPSLVECRTYRIEGHFVGDPRVYCSREEVEDWKKKCPILAFEHYLLSEQVMEAREIEGRREHARRLVDEAVAFADNSPFPAVQSLKEDVYERSPGRGLP
jgi:TPP-dependent pyruvate/acetoin dehydrogenase alpha subunit